MTDSEKVPEQQQLKHQKQQLNHLDGLNGDGGQIQSPADDEPQTPKQIIGKWRRTNFIFFFFVIFKFDCKMPMTRRLL